MWYSRQFLFIVPLTILLIGCHSDAPPAPPKTVATPVPGAIASEPLKYQQRVDRHTQKIDPPVATIPHKVTIKELGMPFYPGSVEDPKGKNGETHIGGKIQFVSERTTSDSPSKVGEWYRKKILGSVMTGSDVVKMVTGNLAGGQKFQIVAVKRNGKTHVVISTTAS